jgi:aspartyl aminopeptidase
MLDFIEKSPSPYHAVGNVKRELVKNGYRELCEGETWTISAGGKYFVSRNMSSIVAFRIPENVKAADPFMIVASHSDSPTFKIKNTPELSSATYTRLSVEKYGGAFMATWLDRPLSVAGKVTVKMGDRLASKLVYIDRDLLLIPSVAIHMKRDINETFAPNVAVDMVPLYSEQSGGFKKLIAASVGESEDDIVSYDLFLVNRQRGTLWGENEEFVSSPRLDDLQCVYSSLAGFLLAKENRAINLLSVLDNEEVGSSTKQGADSTFLNDVCERIYDSLGYTRNDLRAALASSFMVSADNAHALHPNHPELADANERPVMNGGVVIKHNANQRYSTDAESDAIFERICNAAGVSIQHYSNRADMAGGSTLGNIANTHLSIKTVDIGLAQLAMHSSYETAGVRDTELMIRALGAFYSSSIKEVRDGIIDLNLPKQSPALVPPALPIGE